MDDLWKGRSAGLKDENVIEKHKDKDHRHHCCYYFKNFQNRYEMSKSAEKMANNIKSIISKTPTSVTSPRNIEDMETIPSGFFVGVESREQCLQVILTKLLDDQVNCVGVYGMGGIGKTTLVKEVQSKAKANFDTITMAAISEFQNIERIQDQLAEGIDSSLVNVCSPTQRPQKLYNMLLQDGMKGKRKILIILDNMWHKLNLSEVGIPFVSTNEFCCKILMTSRDRIVCEMMGIKYENIIELGVLNPNESKKLFQHHVKKPIDEGDYKVVAQKLLEKCNGLPLNIMTIANMLKENNLSMWQHFVYELEKPTSNEVSRIRRETYTILETSYKFLESEEKFTFFLLACLSPLDSSISIDDLMRYGVGLDLFQNVDKLSEALEQASKWARELVSSSLLLTDDKYELIYLKIHDDIRASAISFAEKDKQQHKFLVEEIPRWISKESLNKYTAISLLSGGHDFSRLDAVKAELLQILLLEGNTSELADGFFQGMPNLKVLHLSCMTFKPQLPASLVELKNLKTLQLEFCELGDISLMCLLTELIVVGLPFSSMEELPAEMGKLVDLRILDMGGCGFKSLTNTKVLASLSSLEGLYLFDEFHKCATDHEFNEFPHLNLLEVVYQLDLNDYNLIHLPLPLSRFFEHLDRFNIVFTRSEEWGDSFSGEHRALQFLGLEPCWESEESEESDFRSANLLDIQALKDSSCIEALIKRTEYLSFH
ncbi:unnamed protein product, partial [Amaranthus hypochondriacus]